MRIQLKTPFKFKIMNVSINIVELASELAHNEIEATYRGQIYINDNDIETIYTDEVQDLFNDLYDKYYSLIDNLKN